MSCLSCSLSAREGLDADSFVKQSRVEAAIALEHRDRPPHGADILQRISGRR